MNRRTFLSGLAALAVFGTPVAAQTAQDQIVRQLQRQGYRNIRVSRTWLGRVRILARGRNGSREIVLNPATGAILRDYLDRDDHDDRGSSGRRSGSGSDSDSDNRGSDDDSRDDDDSSDDDDDDDDDNSGSGSSNSGHGGSDNSGSGGGHDDEDD